MWYLALSVKETSGGIGLGLARSRGEIPLHPTSRVTLPRLLTLFGPRSPRLCDVDHHFPTDPECRTAWAAEPGPEGFPVNRQPCLLEQIQFWLHHIIFRPPGRGVNACYPSHTRGCRDIPDARGAGCPLPAPKGVPRNLIKTLCPRVRRMSLPPDHKVGSSSQDLG